MNGRIATLIRRLASVRGMNNRRHRSALKRKWKSLPHNERAEMREKWEQEIKQTHANSILTTK